MMEECSPKENEEALREARQKQITENFQQVMERVENAVAKRGGSPVTLLAATKMVSPEDITFAIRTLGLRFVGENRVQELLEKYDALREAQAVHLIGSLQTNKVKQIVGKVDMIESVDSLKLAQEISRLSVKRNVITDVLCEVNSGREVAKGGVLPEDVDAFLSQLEELPGIRIRGLMTMAPRCENRQDYLKYFGETSRLLIDSYEKKRHNIIEPVLSMGMSDSFEEAIASGATMVRVGSAIFGHRQYTK